MDISKASNFERFIFDLVGRDADVVKSLWHKVDSGGSFNLAGTAHYQALPRYAMVSGRSTHRDRIDTIRDVWQRYGTMIDTHTADGLKVARSYMQPGIPMVVLETAQAVKFSETIVEALGREPVRPAEMEGIEKLPQRVEVMSANADAVKTFIANNC
jgi:threonine synthase